VTESGQPVRGPQQGQGLLPGLAQVEPGVDDHPIAPHALRLRPARPLGEEPTHLADDIAADVAGSAAAADLFDTLAVLEPVTRTVRDGGRDRASVATWRDAARYVRRDLAERMEISRQRSIREEASLLASHPPAGLRSRMARSRPHREPRVTLTDALAGQIDAELAPWYRQLDEAGGGWL